MSAEEYRAFLTDVREQGVLSPLEITATGLVLDGRHRLRAARELELKTVPVRVVSPRDEVEHMLGRALHRRHLSQSQKAALVVELEEYREEKAAALARRRAGQRVGATLPQGPARTRELAARRAGVCPRLVQDAHCVKEGDPALFEDLLAGHLPAHRAAKRVRRARKLATLPPSPPPLPPERSQLLYADPPWPSACPSSEWSPEQHYPTLPVEEIKALAVPAAEDAVLFLWAVNGSLPEALSVMAAWGFEYRTNLVWVKDYIGLGFWARNRHELLLVGRKGTFPVPDEPDRPDSVIEASKTGHSRKPVSVYELIERMYPTATRLELFARASRPGWTAWGNEVAT